MAENQPPGSDEQPEIDERGISQVAGPSSQNNTLALVAIVGIVAVLLFLVWQSGDDEPATDVTTAEEEVFETPRRVEAPEMPEPEAPAVVPPAQGDQQQQLVSDPYQDELRRLALQQAQEAAKLAEQRRRSPILVLNQSAERSGSARLGQGGQQLEDALASAAAGDSSALTGEIGSADERFAARVGNARVETVRAEYIATRKHMITQGTLIRGVLETAIQSDLPGFIRAEVAHDVYSFDGSNLLIPKGSRLVGQYRSGLVRGQTRVFVIWTRVLRPDGASILVGSPGTDLLGRAGLEGELDTHFFRIFGASILLSLLDGAIDVAVAQSRDQGDDNTTIIEDSGDGLERAAEIALENSINIPPTIHVDQGTPIQVFVAKDLDFRNVELR